MDTCHWLTAWDSFKYADRGLKHIKGRIAGDNSIYREDIADNNERSVLMHG